MMIRIKNLRLRTIIGVNDWERKDRQDIVINVEIEFDRERSPDASKQTPNYRTVTKRIIREVEQLDFRLLEDLASHVLTIVMEDQAISKATVEVDKPHALRFADSVSACCSAERKA